MSRRLCQESAAAAYALAVLAAVLAPALIVARTSSEGGAGGPAWPLDILLVSVLIGVGYAVTVSHRLRRRIGRGRSAANAWIAGVDALVVLAVLGTGLVTVTLHELGGLRTEVADAPGAVSALWAVCLLLAVAVTDVADRALFRWLTD